MPKIFISYNRNDKSFAKKLADRLASEGVDVWLDEKRLRVGDSIIKTLSQAVESSDYMIAVLSESSVKSNWVQQELLWAVTREQELGTTIVLPVVIEECRIPSFLKDKHYISFIDPNEFCTAFGHLIERLFSSDTQETCEYCKNPLPLMLDRCPHCARSAPPPNVRAARVPVERDTLEVRYEAAIEDAKARGCERIARQFEMSVLDSKVVINRSLRQVMLLFGQNDLYSTYYRYLAPREESRPEGVENTLANRIFFPGYGNDIRYGVLSLTGKGLTNYGECSLVLRNDLISHRTSLFQQDTLEFLVDHEIQPSRVPSLPPGYRATWADRGKLAVAKLAHLITAKTTPPNFNELLLKNGDEPHENIFIEAHIWGSITMLAVEQVNISRLGGQKAERAIVKALEMKLKKTGVKLAVNSY